jgi:hypothetical protein
MTHKILLVDDFLNKKFYFYQYSRSKVKKEEYKYIDKEVFRTCPNCKADKIIDDYDLKLWGPLYKRSRDIRFDHNNLLCNDCHEKVK